MLFAVNELGQDIFISDDDSMLFRQKLFCPECHCLVVPAAIHSTKVRPYFRAVGSHGDGCAFQKKIISPEQEAAQNRLDMTRVWSRMFRSEGRDDSDGQQSRVSREKDPLSRPSVHISLDRDYFQKAILELYRLCKEKPLSDYIGLDKVSDMYCGKRTAYIYKSYISGRKLVECRFLRYDREKRSIFYRFPAEGDEQFVIRAKFWREDDLKQAIQDTYSYKGVILLFSHFMTPSKGFVVCDIKSLNQVVYA